MKFGIREITNIVFRTVADSQKFGDLTIAKANTPVALFDSAKTSTVESTVATVYAQGGRGNPRLLAWDGDRVVTFKFEDVIMNKRVVSMLSGANTTNSATTKLHLVENSTFAASSGVTATFVTLDIPVGSSFYTTANVFYIDYTDQEGTPTKLTYTTTAISANSGTTSAGYYNIGAAGITIGIASTSTNAYLIDYYVSGQGTNFTVEAGKFAGYYIIEANTLFRGLDGVDYPAQFTIPRGKLKSNFTFTMSPTGDPSTFTFEVDALPGTTKLISKPVLFQLDIVDGGFTELS
jgi:hypothetical protein